MKQPETPWGINAVAILKTIEDVSIPINEAVATIGLKEYISSRVPDPETAELTELSIRHSADTATCIRTGGLFVFDPDDLPSPGRTRMEDMPTELPPMPFPRCWLEIMTDANRSMFRDADGRYSFALGWAVFEEKQGAKWRIILTLLDFERWKEALEDDRTGHSEGHGPPDFPSDVMCHREYHLEIGPDGYVKSVLNQSDVDAITAMDDAVANKTQEVLMIPEYLITLTHVLGVALDPVRMFRQQKREFKRRYGYDHPQLYFVNMRATGEAHAGHGDREYRHRWIVRGHYRQHKDGRFFHPDKGPCTWVRPYVKGPHGAPWKGRPVYVTAEATS